MTPAEAPEHLFDALYDEHRRAVHAYFLGKTGDTELALDLVQELFLRVWRSLAILAAVPADRRKYWLFSAARNLVVDQYRARASREAAHLARDIDARLVIPCHYEMFEFNTATPEEFVAACGRLGQPHRVLRAGERWSSRELSQRAIPMSGPT